MEDLGESDLRALGRPRHPLDLAPASLGEGASGVLLLRTRLAVLHEIAVHPAGKDTERAARCEPARPLALTRFCPVWPPLVPVSILSVYARAAAGRRPTGGGREGVR